MTPDDLTHRRPPADATRDPSDDALDAGMAAAFGGDTTHLRPPAADPEVGTVIAGKYKLTERIGEGGMGSVWAATQTEPVKRKVAVKLIKAGMDSKAVLARFDAERQALAVMDHPNIAKVLDGGVTADGRPYFVMELVKGVPITEYCDTRKLTLQQRLELFVPVCQAIQHAHQKGVIHRDIKPSNVLVALYDDKPVPKVIDFGVAKATGAALTDHTLDTEFGAVVGTPTYMSPEQASLNNLDIDTRSDVYALGALLYELLAGSPPFASAELKKRGLLELLRVVREEEPPRPSHKLSTADTLPSLSANRGTEPKALTGLLRNELDWIVMKALEKDRGRRYETANGFAADVLRYLAGEAVQAHPPSAGYRLKKFVRRNRVQVTAAGVVLLALVGGVVGTTLGLIEAQAQRQRAETHLTQANENYQLARGAVDRYLTRVGDSRLLNEPYMDELRLELLESAREFYQTFADRRRGDPEAQKDLAIAHLQLADIAWQMSKHEAAVGELRASREVMRSTGPTANATPEYVQSGVRLASYQLQLGHFDEALGTITDTVKGAEGGLGANPDDVTLGTLLARALERRGAIFRQTNQKAEAVADFKRAEEVLVRLARLHPHARDISRDHANLFVHRGQLAYEAQQDDEAEKWHRQALAIRRTFADAEPYSEEAKAGLSVSLSNVAAVLRRKNRQAEAIPLMQEAIDIYRTLVRDHPAVATYRSGLASYLTNFSVIYKTSGASDKADALNQEAIDLMVGLTRQFPRLRVYSLGLGTAESNEGNSAVSAKKWDDAIRWFDRSNATLEPLLEGADDPRVRVVLRNNHWGRADAYAAKGDFAAAVSAFDRAIETAEERIRPELRLARALALAKSGDHQQARAAAEAELARESAKKHHWFDASKVFVAAAAAADAPETAAELNARAVAALRRACELKYFEDARSRSELRGGEFDPLREREDFKKLIADLEAKYPPKKDAPTTPEKK